MTKRTSDQFLAMGDNDLDHELENMPINDSPDAIRRKIRAFIDGGEMKVGEFQKAINANSVSYSRFMSQNGPGKGAGSNVYMNAWAFFKKRELRGLKMPNKKAKMIATESAQPDISGVVLPGEMNDSVEVYDTCDEVRRKINAHLRQPGVTQAQFLRDIAAQYHTKDRKVQSKQLADFRSKKGPYSGNTSIVFYGAYVFFEKLRVKEGKPKSKKRLDMEMIHGPSGGMDTERTHDRILCRSDMVPVMDQYGVMRTIPK
ncbi:hypothetical protein BCR34DRAFT_568903 [Clohesyomyces aquaticus]|uniref:DUF7726 domain-containing protein n=1 Tax=Clohesyomyces aquaticus TaxID=1231657 RepID=A0A1Y1ZFZ8_9PLEO|nr:hypothetical protein BCR34DRAFT_568903 [Clohesyomyces aquaticus]